MNPSQPNPPPSKEFSSEFVREAAGQIVQARNKILHCFSQLSQEQVWWKPSPELNSVGHLCLHITGNLQQWGIVPITGEADERNRAEEFSTSDQLARVDMLHKISAAAYRSRELWEELTEDQLLARHNIQGFDVSLMKAIMHTSTHFVGHTHQIIYLTRLQLGTGYRFDWTPDDDRGQLPI